MKVLESIKTEIVAGMGKTDRESSFTDRLQALIDKHLRKWTSHIMSHHVTSCHIMSHHVTSCHIMSHHVTSSHIMSHHVTSCHIISHHVTSCHIISHHLTSCHIISHHVTSCHIMSHHLTSSHIMSSCQVTFTRSISHCILYICIAIPQKMYVTFHCHYTLVTSCICGSGCVVSVCHSTIIYLTKFVILNVNCC